MSYDCVSLKNSLEKYVLILLILQRFLLKNTHNKSLSDATITKQEKDWQTWSGSKDINDREKKKNII